jgi:CheY-like chemotaxis protein
VRVLVVDDNVDSADAMALLVRYYGHDVLVAHDGEDALRLAETYRPHAILLDLGLPRVDGYEVTRRLRAESWAARTTIVAISGWGQDADLQRSRQAGCDHHLVKPAEPQALKTLLDDLGRSLSPDQSA